MMTSAIKSPIRLILIVTTALFFTGCNNITDAHEEDSVIQSEQVINTSSSEIGDPESRQDCMRGGWESFGFENQGQCIRFVNTGQDSRESAGEEKEKEEEEKKKEDGKEKESKIGG